MAGKRTLHEVSFTPDGNVATYRPEDDGRNTSGERIRYVALASVHPSARQTRLTRDEKADRLLADDIDATGLIHSPVVRPHPALAQHFEVVVGHRRVEALRQLAAAGRGHHVLRPGHDDTAGPLIPVVVREMDDVTAQTQTIAENLLRSDLRPWEQALALESLRRVLEAEGGQGSVRGVAAYLDASHRTVGPYLRVARRLDGEVLGHLAGDDGQQTGGLSTALCALSLQALLRAARGEDVPARSQRLRAELARAGLTGNADRPGGGGATDPLEEAATDITARPFHLTIRRPVRELTRQQARRYLNRLTPLVAALEKVADIGDSGQTT